MSRTLADVNREYGQLCTQLGDLDYKISRLEKAKSDIRRQIVQLDKEAMRLGSKEQPKEAEVVSEQQPTA